MPKFQIGVRAENFLKNQIGVNEVHLHSSSGLGAIKAGLDASKAIGRGGDKLMELGQHIQKEAPTIGGFVSGVGNMISYTKMPIEFLQHLLPESPEEKLARERQERFMKTEAGRAQLAEINKDFKGFEMASKQQRFRGATVGTRTASI